MVTIPEQLDPTIEAMKRACENAQNNKTSKRNYLGASIIGKECVRQIWYDYNSTVAAVFDANSLWNFEDGYRVEDLTAERLRLVDGVELWTHDENGQQFGFSALDGKFKGHCDGVIRGLVQAPKALHVWENKSCGQKSFDNFISCRVKFGEKLALKNWNVCYFAQAQIYMHYLNIDRHYLTVALSGGRDYATCRTEYDPEAAQFYIDRADKILKSREPPPRINNKPDFYLCRFCSFANVCHDEKNTTPISIKRNPIPF